MERQEVEALKRWLVGHKMELMNLYSFTTEISNKTLLARSIRDVDEKIDWCNHKLTGEGFGPYYNMK